MLNACVTPLGLVTTDSSGRVQWFDNASLAGVC